MAPDPLSNCSCTSRSIISVQHTAWPAATSCRHPRMLLMLFWALANPLQNHPLQIRVVTAGSQPHVSARKSQQRFQRHCAAPFNWVLCGIWSFLLHFSMVDQSSAWAWSRNWTRCFWPVSSSRSSCCWVWNIYLKSKFGILCSVHFYMFFTVSQWAY